VRIFRNGVLSDPRSAADNAIFLFRLQPSVTCDLLDKMYARLAGKRVLM
jgi:hypothetical protein